MREKCRQIIVSELVPRDLNCHGGITYIGDGALPWGKFPGFWLGWDYAHAGDYIALPEGYPEDDGHKWAATEILNEIKEFIAEMPILCDCAKGKKRRLPRMKGDNNDGGFD